FDDGLPYIDTQLVGDPAPTESDPHAVTPGTSLDRRSGQPMGVREAVGLIEGIARGIAAAHARGIVHRDIKPANIIVTASGRAQLADFGLSAMIERGDPSRPRRSRHRITGTPAFMAPEQARGEPATPASDIYALGATLGFLLTGALPGGWSSDSGTTGASEMIERLRRGETMKLAMDPRAARVPAAVCSVVDLAMAGDVSARYASATQLADDLRAWLDHRPTLAASPGAGARAILWCRRHAAPVVVASFALVTIVMLSWRSYAQVVRARDVAVQAQQEATTQRDAAVEAQRTTNAINTFMLGTLINAQADEGGRTITLLEAVNQAERGIEPLLGSKPLVEAGVRHVIGRSLATLGEFSRAKAHLERALELRRELLKPDDRNILEVEFALAEMLHFSDQNALALEQVAAMQQQARAALGEDDPLVRSIIELDCAVRIRTKPDPSIRTTLESLLAWHQNAATVDENRVASVLELLGKFAKQTGDRQKAIEYFTQRRALQEKLTGAESYASMSAASDLGSVHAELGNVAEAEPLQRASSAWFAEHLGDTHVHTLNATYNLAWMLLTKKKAAAESLAIATPLVAHARAAVGDRNALTLRVRLLEARGLAATDPGERVLGLLARIADDAAAVGPEALSTEAVACRTYVETCTKLGLTDQAQAWKERAADTLKRARGQQ
ncbi:MAG: serine/threonine-protein kinase, partial [Planctomycetota bacterium]|nr:serine/threonine-protein kinase [Planctomycetota bacterium]